MSKAQTLVEMPIKFNDAEPLRSYIGKFRELDVSELVTDGTVDWWSKPASKSKTGNWTASFLIFGCEVGERMAYYAISSTLTIYLTTMLGEDTSKAATTVNVWGGTTFLAPLLGAFIADAYIGRYWTITTFSGVYFIALVCVALSVSLPSLRPSPCIRQPHCTGPSSSQVAIFYGALYLMAIAGGGIKSSVAGFAGDQFDEGDPKENKRKKSFPNWWFMSISSGTMLSVSVLVWLGSIAGWSWGYGVPAVITGLFTLAFLCGTPCYRHRVPSSSPFTRVAQVIVASTRKWQLPAPADADLLNEIHDKEALKDPAIRRLPHTPQFRFLDKAAYAGPDPIVYTFNGEQQNPWELCTVTQVEEVKLLLRMMPIWATNLMFTTVFSQNGTLYLSQGTTMDRSMGSHFQIPAASFPLFVTLTICMLLPFYDKCLVPFVRKFTGDERGFSMLQRIGVGQAISTLSVTVAAVVEMKRMKVAADHGLLDSVAGRTQPLPMSIFWLIPQYALTGVCEVFISAGQMEFFYDQAPDTMRSVGSALYLSTIAMGNFISGVLVTIVTKATHDRNGGWIGNNLNRSHLDYFFWLLAALSAFNLVLFVNSARWYTYKKTGSEGTDRKTIQDS